MPHRSATIEPAPRRYLRNVAAMALLWLVLGLVNGLCSVPDYHPLSVLAWGLAGTIVFVPIGVLLGLAGGRWWDCLAGAASGLAIASAATVVMGRPNVGYFASFGLVFGGLVGATLGAVLRLPRRAWAALNRLLAEADSPAASAQVSVRS